MKQLLIENFKRMMAMRHQYGAIEANKSYEDTELHQALIVNADSLGYTFDQNDDRPERIIKSFFAAVSAFLGKRKVTKEDEAVALVLQDTSANFKFAAIGQYTLNSNPDEEGSWSFEFTLDEEQLQYLEKEKTVHKYLVGDDSFKSIFDKVSYDIGGFVFEREAYMYDACLIVIDSIVQTLDHMAVDNATETLEMEGYFIAKVSVENGEKFFGIEPHAEMKTCFAKGINID